MVWEVTGVWEMCEGVVVLEPGDGDGNGEEKAGSRETR